MTNIERAYIKEICLNGLMTDGSHHKQWYLEKILLLVDPEFGTRPADKLYELEKGIAP